jgi:hypothetical protein
MPPPPFSRRVTWFLFACHHDDAQHIIVLFSVSISDKVVEFRFSVGLIGSELGKAERRGHNHRILLEELDGSGSGVSV